MSRFHRHISRTPSSVLGDVFDETMLDSLAPHHAEASRHEHVAVSSVGAVMLALEVPVEPADLLPFTDREDSIQGVEVRDLDVGRRDVPPLPPTKEMRRRVLSRFSGVW